MKVLVTGGLGFIGSNLSHKLVNEGHDVSIIDNLHTGSIDNASTFRDKVKIFEMDSGDIEKTGEKYDIVFHQGVYSSSPMYKKDPHLTSKAIDEFISILEYARKHGSRIVFACSSSVYNGISPPQKEDSQIKVTDFYTEARLAMERLARLYNDLYGVKSVGLRYFSCYGPHEKHKKTYANLITQFLWEMKEGRKPVIFGDGSQTRDFTYVDDIVEANILAMKYDKSDIFNVGKGESTDLNTVVKVLNDKLGKNIVPEYRENHIKNYVQHTLADTSKAEKLLGFKARTSLEQGIEKLIEFYG